MPKFLCRTVLVLLTATVFLKSQAQNNYWRMAAENSFATSELQKRMIQPVAFGACRLDTAGFLAALRTAPREFTVAARNNPLVLALPMPDGSTARFAVVYSPMMEPGLEAQFPNIRTYSGQGVDDKSATLKMDWTEFGFHAQVFSAKTGAFYIDPYARGEKTQYISYFRKDLPATKQHIEEGLVKQEISSLSGVASRGAAGFCLGTQLRTYRLAVACTGEYAVAVGATNTAQALSAVTTSVNRVNGIYETELSVRLTLVANNSAIMYTDPATDPFTQNNNGSGLMGESQSVITANIGSANYDIGHTFSTGAGGIATLGCVCSNTTKARGVTGSPLPVGDAYDVDFVAHEMGHQFGANHSFNATTGNCGGGTINFLTAVEPGSGITIMGYAGICGTNDLAAHSIPYFHTISQAEIGTFITAGNGSTCGVVTSTGNTLPVVNAGSDYTIPASTPFVLTGSATDINNSEVLTYSWEEFDAGIGADWNSGNAPFFRSFAPTLSPSRYFPQLSDVANGTTTIGEILPATAQTLNFRLTARDNRSGSGGTCSDDMVLTVSTAAGPFTVTSQTTATTWTAGSTTTVTWNVANTNIAPINTTNVTILFSADGGLTFPYTLVASTANNGSASITIPSIKTSKGRVMVKAIGNIFFNVNSGNITINTTCNAEGAVISPSSSVSAMYGNAALNLSLAPQYSTTFAPSGQITSGDPVTNLTALNAGSCAQFSNNYSYDTYTFTVSLTGSYTFTRTGAGSVFNFYTTAYTPGSCTNFITSNFVNGSGTSASVSVNLTAGQVYVLVIGVYWISNNTTPNNPLPFDYSFTVTPPAGGVVYNGTGIYLNPGAGFNYAYVVVNNATGNIVSIGTSNLTNSSTYPIGQYTIYGLSYSSSISNLNTYVGGSFNNFATQVMNNPSTFCANLSKNTVTVNVTGTFPVQFTALKARKQGEKVALDWGTVTEQNSSHFMVQRSANGSDFNAEIGKVAAAGNSNSQRNYNYIDAAPLKGWNYYRIRQVDVDGKSLYSNIASVNFNGTNSLLVVYPNPAKDQLTIEYTSERSGRLQLQVIDSKGAILSKKTMQVTAGRNIDNYNIASLSSGMYLLKYIDADGNVSFTKFVKQ